jgi:CHASE3 domain sensor protein
MAISDELAGLTARAKEAQARAESVRDKAGAEIEQHVSSARAAAEARADELRQKADDGKGRISAAREEIATRKAEHDVHKARKVADEAEDQASFVIDLAYSAVVEAEYAALDAYLARAKADELSAAAGEARGPVG